MMLKLRQRIYNVTFSKRHCEERSDLCGCKSNSGKLVRKVSRLLCLQNDRYCTLNVLRRDCFVPRNDARLGLRLIQHRLRIRQAKNIRHQIIAWVYFVGF